MDRECYACGGSGFGIAGPDGPRCYLCKGSGETPEDEFGDRADYEYDKWRDRQMERENP